MARPTKCTKARMNRIVKLIESDDYTVSEICKQVKLAESTYYDWKANNTEFSEAIKKAEERRLDTFKAAARSGLLTLLKGKEWEEVTIEYIEDNPNKKGRRQNSEDKEDDQFDSKSNKPKIKSMKKVKKFIMPQPAAVIFTLKNLDDKNFSDLIKTEHSGSLNASFMHFLKESSAASTPDSAENPLEGNGNKNGG